MSWLRRISTHFTQVVDLSLYVVILSLVFIIGLACFYNEYPEGDVYEHIYSTYMVSSGYVPYRDFFEHHHPLLWYIFVPLVRLLDHNITIIGWVNYLTFCWFLCGLYFLYKIMCDFFCTRTGALLSIIYILLPNIFLYYIYFKPDNWVFTLICMGIYAYFGYLRDKKCYFLVGSYLAFAVALLFTQKALFYCAVLGGFSLWNLYKKDISVRDFCRALVLPVIIVGVWISYWYLVGALKQYFVLNFLFNQKMVGYFHGYHLSDPFLIGKIFMIFAVIISLFFYKKESKYFRFWCWLFWIIGLQKIFYFSPHTYYWYEAYYLAVPIAMVGIMRLAEKSKLLLYCVVIETIIYAAFLWGDICHDVRFKPKLIGNSIHEMTINNMNRCDIVVSFNRGVISLFNRNPVYYWFLLGQIDVFGEKMGIHPVENLNEYVVLYKPKFVWVDEVTERYSSDMEHPRLIHKPNMEIIEKFYEPTFWTSDIDEFDFEIMDVKKRDFLSGLWVLKREYQQRNCVFNKNNGKWEYVQN